MSEKFYFLGLKERQSKKSDKVYNIATIIIEDNYRYTLKEVIITDDQAKKLAKLDNDLNDISNCIGVRYNSYTNQFDLSLNID